jgi:hypothetical protein
MEKEVVIYDRLVNKDIKVLYKHLFNKTLYIELKGALRECYIKKVVTEYNGYFLYSSIVLNVAEIGEYTLDGNKSIAQSNAWKLYLSVGDYKDKKYYDNRQCMNDVEVHQIFNRILGKECIKIDRINGDRCLSTYEWNGVKPIEVYPKLPNVIIQDENGFYFDTNGEIPQYYASEEECEKDNVIKVITFPKQDFQKKLEEYDKLNSQIEVTLNSLRMCLMELDTDQYINYMANELSKRNISF